MRDNGRGRDCAGRRDQRIGAARRHRERDLPCRGGRRLLGFGPERSRMGRAQARAGLEFYGARARMEAGGMSVPKTLNEASRGASHLSLQLRGPAGNRGRYGEHRERRARLPHANAQRRSDHAHPGRESDSPQRCAEFTVAGGTAGIRYQLAIVVVLSSGAKLKEYGIVSVVETALPPI